MLGFLLKSLDPAPDKELGELAGPGYNRAIGLLGWMVLALLLIVGATLVVAISGRSVPPTQFYLVDSQNRKFDAQAGLSPVLSTPKIEKWTERALIDAHSFNFLDIEQRLERSRVWFDPLAYNQYMASMRARGVVETVQKYRLKVWLTPVAPATVVQAFQYEGSIFWRVEVPSVVSYTGDNPPASKYLLFNVLVKQASTVDNPDGLTIVKISSPDYQPGT